MKAMKRYILLTLALVAAMGLNAQEQQYTQKLDSVVGSNDFDWTRWKQVFSYQDSLIEAVTYIWQDQAWMADEKTETRADQVKTSRWNGEEWEEVSLTTYEYDELGHQTLVMNYYGVDTLGAWIEYSKYQYSYNAAGLVDTCLYSTKRNGNWRESERSLYTYDESNLCQSLKVQRKGGWGPGANQWRDSYRYDYEYEDGELARELYYATTGWFGGDMSLQGMWEYEFDTNGNLLQKTGSVFNEEDWIVRDVYENHFDATVDANTVQGLQAFWQSLVGQGMGFSSGASMPLKNLWLSCSIITAELDTEFTLYCSGFEGVEEEQAMPLKAYSSNGRLTVACEQPADIMVFDLMGRVVASENQAQQCEFNLTPGLYVVGSGNARVKVIVK